MPSRPRAPEPAPAPLESPRAAGWLLALSAIVFLLSFIGEAYSPRVAQALRIVALLMQVPGAMALGMLFAPRREVLVMSATAAGVASLLLWASAGILLPWSVEPLYIALSGVWWLGLGLVWPRQQRALRVFTLVLAGFAFADAVVSLAYDHIPFWLFALAGGPKIPLSIVWAAWAGVALGRARLGRRR